MVSAAIWIVSFIVVITFVGIVLMLILGALTTQTGRNIAKVIGFIGLAALTYGVYEYNHLPKTTASQSETSSEYDTAGFSNAYKTNFKNSCLATSNNNEQSCECALQVVQTHYTYSQVETFERTGYPSSFTDTIKSTCAL